MPTSTSRLALSKPANDGSEFVDVSTDLNANLDKIDAAIGFVPATSSTPPASPFAGMARIDTDTGKIYVRDGSNSSWLQIFAAGTSFGANIQLDSTKKIGIGTSPTGTAIDVVHNTSAEPPIKLKVSGDTQYRNIIEYDGLTLGSGSAVGDTNLYRSGVNALGTDGSLSVGTDLTVSGDTTLSTVSLDTVDVSGVSTFSDVITYLGYNVPRWLEGEVTISITTGGSAGTTAVSFGVTLPRVPRIFCNLSSGSGNYAGWNARAINPATTGFTVGIYSNGNTMASTTSTLVQWVALL